ncbi:MAG: hypothetical protein ACJAZO_000760 [Myxococcota bacterium]|jgi:hypothetical protein
MAEGRDEDAHRALDLAEKQLSRALLAATAAMDAEVIA